MSVQIISYDPKYKSAFKELNMAWLEEFFTPESYDIEVLSNPEKYILEKGGEIFFLLEEGKAMGTFALMWNEENELEFTKMAVEKNTRGKSYGKLLMQHCIDEARKLNSDNLILYSNTKLEPAIHIYRKFGFEEIPLEASHYQRANIKMLLNLKKQSSTN